MRKNYQYLLFDWDGCLAKTLQIHLEAYKTTFNEYDVYPSDLDITQKVFGDWNGPAHLGVEDVKDFTNIYLSRVNTQFADAPLYPHVFDTIKKLSQSQKKLALVTTSTINLIEPALRRTQLFQFFPIVLAAEDVKTHKPSPEIIYTALEKMGGIKEEAIIIGDSKSDLGAAKNAGIDSVLFSPEDHEIFYNENELIQNFSPTFVIKDHSELLDILL